MKKLSKKYVLLFSKAIRCRSSSHDFLDFFAFSNMSELTRNRKASY